MRADTMGDGEFLQAFEARGGLLPYTTKDGGVGYETVEEYRIRYRRSCEEYRKNHPFQISQWVPPTSPSIVSSDRSFSPTGLLTPTRSHYGDTAPPNPSLDPPLQTSNSQGAEMITTRERDNRDPLDQSLLTRTTRSRTSATTTFYELDSSSRVASTNISKARPRTPSTQCLLRENFDCVTRR